MTEKVIPQMGDPIPEETLKVAEAEVKSNQRIIHLKSFRGDTDVEISIVNPTPYTESLASGAYSRVFSKLLQEGDLMTRKQLVAIFEERGIWGKVEEDKLTNLYEDKYNLELSVAEARSKDKISAENLKKQKTKWLGIQGKINDLLSEKTQFLFNSIERHAEEAETKAKLSQCVKTVDGTSVWPTVDDLDREEDNEAIGYITHEALFFWRGLSPEIIQDLPANILFGGEEDQETEQTDEEPETLLSDE